ncbi:MAG: AtpZ/AtpI family protein [Phaeodactylibacter sp.]|nr:AtpZ/AtpI family protein [Phaeodactylibacter sp.]MCB0612778.1 AtpZ/AtpI family protein [Phaeodactylibacter sp.]
MMEPKNIKKQSKLSREVGSQEGRKLRARRKGKRNLWFGIGMFGLVGWSIAVPTLLGTALGVWLDGHYPQRFSWTLTLLITGLTAGCFNAWFWVDRESREIQKDLEENDE